MDIVNDFVNCKLTVDKNEIDIARKGQLDKVKCESKNETEFTIHYEDSDSQEGHTKENVTTTIFNMRNIINEDDDSMEINIELQEPSAEVSKATAENSEKHRTYHCRFCDFNTRFRYLLTRHFKVKHDDTADWLHCKSCEYRTKNLVNLKSHVKWKHVDNVSHQCQFCQYKTKDKSTLNRHVKLKHRNGKHQCNFCEYSTNSLYNLKVHKNLKHDDDIFHHCMFCEYETKAKKCLTYHLKSKHSVGLKWHQCKFCDFRTKHKASLTRHFLAKHDKECIINRVPGGSEILQTDCNCTSVIGKDETETVCKIGKVEHDSDSENQVIVKLEDFKDIVSWGSYNVMSNEGLVNYEDIDNAYLKTDPELHEESVGESHEMHKINLYAKCEQASAHIGFKHKVNCGFDHDWHRLTLNINNSVEY